MGKKEKLVSNIEAIETALKIQKSDRITDKDKIILSKYSGFGELKCVLLNPNKPEQFSESEKNLIPYVEQLHKVLSLYSKDEKEFQKYLSSVKQSVLTAFYTPEELINSISNSFTSNNLSFPNLLEPSAGTGAFLTIKAEKYLAIEKDLLTGRILAALNPDKEVLISGFEEIPSRYKGTFNLVISNIPFGDFKVFDAEITRSIDPERGKACNTIHSYFFEKGLDMIKDGGILAFITSTGIMDSQNTNFRRHLLTRSNIISALRLPAKTFSGTEVMSDLIVLQKNENKKSLSKEEKAFIETDLYHEIKSYYSSSYYQLKPQNIIRTSSKVGTNLYGKEAIIHEHSGGIKGIASDVEKHLKADIKSTINIDLFNRNLNQNKSRTETRQLSLFDDFNSFINNRPMKPDKLEEFEYTNSTCNKVNSFQSHEGYIGLAVSETKATVLNIDDKSSIELIQAYIKVRDCYYSLKDWENEYLKEAKDLREALNKEYDSFVKEYGNLTDSINILNTDSSFPEVRSLELNRNGQLVKADIFHEPTAFTKAKDTYSPEEALTISLNKFNAVDLAYISKITGKSEDQLINIFEDKIYLNPETMKFEPASVYISGNIYKKLDYALNTFQENNSNRALFKSVDALQKAIPEKIQFEDIGISLGERWIPNKIFSSFASEIFEGQINVSYNSLLDDFNINGVTTYRASEKYSVKSHNRYYGAIDVLRFALLDNIPELTKKIQNGDNVVTIPDTEGIQKMNASVSLLQEEFSQWLHKLPPDIKTELENTYNRLFNCFIKPSYNGSWQTFPELNKDGLNIKDLYETQKNAILLVKNNGGGIIDHEVLRP